MTATLKQARKVLEVLDDVSSEKLQQIHASGAIADLRDGDLTKFDREVFRKMIGLGPLMVEGILVPKGGRIHVVHVLVDESIPWNDAVNDAGPNTLANYDIRKVGDQYPPKAGATPKMRVIYLINFGKGKNTMGDDNIAWGKTQKLRLESPRAVFAIAKDNPTLDEVLGMKGCMAVVSLEESSFEGYRRAPSAWWCGTGREARLGYFVNVWHGDHWFAFSRELELGASDSVAIRQQAEAK